MLKWFCENEECSEYMKLVPHTGKLTYVFRNGTLIPATIKRCPVCGKEMSYKDEKNTEMPNLKVGTFSGMSNEQKADVLKKRAALHNKKPEVQEQIKRNREKVMKNMIMGGTNK